MGNAARAHFQETMFCLILRSKTIQKELGFDGVQSMRKSALYVKYVFYAGYVKYAFCAYIYFFTFARFKKDGVAKDIRIFSTGFLHLIDKLFWKIPFTTPSKLRKSVSNSRSLTMCWMQTVTGSRYLRNTMGTAPATNCNLDGKCGWHNMRTSSASPI